MSPTLNGPIEWEETPREIRIFTVIIIKTEVILRRITGLCNSSSINWSKLGSWSNFCTSLPSKEDNPQQCLREVMFLDLRLEQSMSFLWLQGKTLALSVGWWWYLHSQKWTRKVGHLRSSSCRTSQSWDFLRLIRREWFSLIMMCM